MSDSLERSVRDRLANDFSALEAARSELEAYVRQVCARLSRAAEFRLRFVEARVKPASSVIRKLQEKSSTADQLYLDVGDILGARVVVYNLSDVDTFREEVLADAGCPLRDIDLEEIDNPAGYRALHVNGRLGDYGSEIQVRTAVQDAWAVTSRADVYRATDEKLLIERLSGAQSNVLRGVDDVLQVVRDLRSGGDRQAEVRAELADADAVPPAVRRRMSEAAAPAPAPDPRAIQEAIEGLDQSDHFVLDGRISHDRVHDLKSESEKAFENSTISRMFRAVGRYERLYEFDADLVRQIRQLTFKGPFVEGSNWGLFNGSHEIARAFESLLLGQLFDLMLARMDGETFLADARDVLRFVEESVPAMESVGAKPDVLILVGDPADSISEGFFDSLEWTPSPRIRDVDIARAGFVVGSFGGRPVIRYHDDDLEAAIHLVDLEDFRLIHANPAEGDESPFLLDVTEIQQQQAQEILTVSPTARSLLHRAVHHSEGELTKEEAIVQLMLRAELLVEFAGEVREAHEPRTRSAKLARSDDR